MNFPFVRLTGTAIFAASLLSCGPALAWSQPGHMLTAAIAFDDLSVRDRTAVDTLADIISRHPDRGPFSVAIDRATGPERALRLMMECARWPDDARGTLYDHPTWHYADRPIASDGAHAPDATSGQAIEALQLNFLEASDAKAPAADRAIALCWVMHLAGDIHQPLHTASIYSKTYPQGDAGGTQQFIQDPDTRQVESLHWFWDDRVEKSADVRTIEANAADLEKRFPRASLSELSATQPNDYAHWAFDESHAIAVASAYPDALKTSATNVSAPALPPGYAQTVSDIASRRIALAGYRLADLLHAIAAVPLPEKKDK